MLEVCASKIGDIILSVLESKMENTYSNKTHTGAINRKDSIKS